MIGLILFIMIGLKLSMLNGWYLGLIILYALLLIIQAIVKGIKIGNKLNQ